MNNKKKYLLASVAVSIIVILVIMVWILWGTRFNQSNTSDTVQAVGKHYLLPNEEPAVATVEDKEKVQSEFFRAAENGDKLLIYKEAKKVILYRPSVDRIVEVGPVSIAPAADAGQ